jgi:hypothetical protein
MKILIDSTCPFQFKAPLAKIIEYNKPYIYKPPFNNKYRGH